MADKINILCPKGSPSDNPLAIYCKENGNMVLLDPAGAIPNNSVNQEDLIIYATLKARVKNKSLVTGKPDEVKTTINFVKGNDIGIGQAPIGENFLPTNKRLYLKL